MGGGDAGLKAIAKRQKQNGLGRLRLYCQMCEKQCRDENGFKCHAATPAHQTNLALFASQPELFVDRFSKQFLSGFIGVLQQRYGSNPVAANTVYQDYIKDKEHVHMNSTRWSTLSEFAKDLGRRGICRVDERDGALWVVFIDRHAIERKQRAQEIDRIRLDDEERAEQSLARQMENVLGDMEDDTREYDEKPAAPLAPVDIRLSHGSAAERVSLSKTVSESAFKSLKSSKLADGGRNNEETDIRRRDRKKKLTVLDEIMAEDRAREEALQTRFGAFSGLRSTAAAVHREEIGSDKKHHVATPDVSAKPAAIAKRPGKAPPLTAPWLCVGITVKCVTKSLKGGPYYKQKGIVQSLRDKYTAVVRLNESEAVLEMDQDDLETVLPKPGGPVVFLRGEHKGKRGILQCFDEKSYSASVHIEASSPPLYGIDYDIICKCIGR